MPSVLHPLLLIFARVTHHQLARMVQYLKVENAAGPEVIERLDRPGVLGPADR